MDQVLISLKKPGLISLEILDSKRKELVILGNVLQYGEIKLIFDQVKRTYDAGASKEDIMRVASFVFRNDKIIDSIIELIKAIEFEENKRAPYISIIDDCKEIDWNENMWKITQVNILDNEGIWIKMKKICKIK